MSIRQRRLALRTLQVFVQSGLHFSGSSGYAVPAWLGSRDSAFGELAVPLAPADVRICRREETRRVLSVSRRCASRRADIQFSGHSHQQLPQIQRCLFAIEARQTLNQRRRDDHHRIGVAIRVADQQTWPVLDRRGHEVEIHPQTGKRLGHRTIIRATRK